MKIEKLLERQDTLNKILTKDLPFNLSYKLSKLANGVQQEMKHINETKNKMIKQFGIEEETGGYKIEKESIPAFEKVWKEFIEEEVEVKEVTVDKDVLEKIELSAVDVLNLEGFIKIKE